MSNFQGRVAIVTGGGRGIGAASARLLAEQGARVVVNYLRNADAAEQVVAHIRSHGGQASAVQANIQERDQAERLFEVALSTYGRLDILVQSASSSAVIKPFAHMSWEEFAQGVNNELKAAFNSTKAALEPMQRQQYGRIVYLGSGLAKAPGMPGGISIAAAKGGLLAFARYVAKEYGPAGITANVVAPGIVETELSAQIPAAQKQQMAALTPLGRIAQPQDVARVVAFFASEESGFLTGTATPVTGGLSME